MFRADYRLKAGQPTSSKSGEDLLDNFSVIHLEPLAAGYFQFVRIQAELMENRRVNIRHIRP